LHQVCKQSRVSRCQSSMLKILTQSSLLIDFRMK
jgi:hypothetical protein